MAQMLNYGKKNSCSGPNSPLKTRNKRVQRKTVAKKEPTPINSTQ